MRIGKATSLMLTLWVATCFAGDFSGVPISGKRAYGRVQETSMIVQNATLKKLNLLTTKDKFGQVNGTAQVYALSLLARDGTGFLLYFTLPTEATFQNVIYRRKPNLKGTPEYRQNMLMEHSPVPLGITSAQMLFRLPGNRTVQSKVFKNMFSARMVLGSLNSSGLSGQIILVMPDSRKSFVSGAFKAQLVGF